MTYLNRQILRRLGAVACAAAMTTAMVGQTSGTASGYTNQQPAAAAAGQPSGLYAEALRDGKSSIAIHLNYLQGRSDILPALAGNAAELQRLDAFVRHTLSDPSVFISRISLTGYCSIEGSQELNRRISNERARTLKTYIDARYRLSDKADIVARGMGEDWAGMRKLLDDDKTLYGRDEMLRIIDLVPDFDDREKLMTTVLQGVPWKQAKQRIIAKQRRVELIIEYDVRRMIEQRYGRRLTDEEYQNALKVERNIIFNFNFGTGGKAAPEESPEPAAAPMKKAKKQKTRTRYNAPDDAFRPFFGIKSNLVQLAGLMPNGKYYTPTPNICLEIYILPWLSVEGKALYANWDYGSRQNSWIVTDATGQKNHTFDNQRHGLSAYSGEIRIWPFIDGKHRWLYVGPYFQSGDFTNCNWADDRVEDGLKNCTGTYLSAGLTLGTYIPFSNHWGLEAGLRLGYRRSKNYTFVRVPQDAQYFLSPQGVAHYELQHWYLDTAPQPQIKNHIDNPEQPTHPHTFGIMETRLAIVYRWGRKIR